MTMLSRAYVSDYVTTDKHGREVLRQRRMVAVTELRPGEAAEDSSGVAYVCDGAGSLRRVGPPKLRKKERIKARREALKKSLP